MKTDYKKCQQCKHVTRTFDKEDTEFEYYELGCVKNSEPSKCKNFVPDIKEKRK